MIFPNYNYQEFHNGNKEQWPIQPPTQEAWNNMHNEAVKYCENINHTEYKGKPTELPSFHTYWKYKAEESTYNYYKLLITKLEKCNNNPELYKTEFRGGATYPTVVKQILEIRQKCLSFPEIEIPEYNYNPITKVVFQ